jgi:hypothetical protein
MRFICFLFLSVLSLSSLAQVESVLTFRGQNGDEVNVSKSVDVTRPAPYKIPATCYNQVPYQSYECQNVTRHRQECQWIPSSQRCWSENERICRNVTRTREECHQGPSRQVCTQIPVRRVCTQIPVRQVCRTDNNGRQHCQTVGGGQNCQTVGGGQTCSTVPGERMCRLVSYVDQECQNIPRQRCENVPGRNACRDIPYSENVCGYETRYRAEPYACQRTEYRDETKAKQLNVAIQVQFITNGLVEEFPLEIKVLASNNRFEDFNLSMNLLKEPEVLVLIKKKSLNATESMGVINIEGEVIIEILDNKMVGSIFPTKFTGGKFNKETNLLKLPFEGSISGIGSVEAQIVADPLMGPMHTVVNLKAEYPSSRVNLEKNSLILNLSGLLKGKVSKNNEVSLKIISPNNLQGDLLNIKKPVLERSYQFSFRK